MLMEAIAGGCCGSLPTQDYLLSSYSVPGCARCWGASSKDRTKIPALGVVMFCGGDKQKNRNHGNFLVR